jgi:prepilin-type N-terminal cleavage/methylation domain-containing protein
MLRHAIRKTGFTLIELLVVMAIIGILSAVVLTSLNGARQKGRDARRISDIKQIQLALELYYDSTNAYPVAIGPANNSVLVNNGFIASLPIDPSNNAVYSYTPYAATTNTSICSSYHLGADLESGVTHTVLQTDADVTATAPAISGTPPTGGETLQTASPILLTVCTGGGTDFHGADTQKCNSGNIGTACFDVRA